MPILSSLIGALVTFSGSQAAPPPPSPPATPTAVPAPASAALAAVPFPHPLITEVLFAVPTGDAGDANQDGTRNVAGDEFVELINPHDKPIQLAGYSLTDSNPPGKGQLSFRFPALELPPRAVVVVFNGNASTWTGPVGDSSAAAEPNDRFHNAFVFTMRIDSQRTAFNNTADHILLRAPDGAAVQRVWWGKADKAKAAGGSGGAPLDEEAPLTSKSSIQRASAAPGARFTPHAPTSGKPFSPGLFGPATAAPTSPPATAPVQPAANPPTAEVPTKPE